MSVGAIGSTIFTNQMTPAVSSTPNAHNNRVDLQNVMAQSAVQERDEQVLEVRPTEENQEVDEDREHSRDEADRETKRAKSEGEEEEQEIEGVHKLDIKV